MLFLITLFFFMFCFRSRQISVLLPTALNQSQMLQWQKDVIRFEAHIKNFGGTPGRFLGGLSVHGCSRFRKMMHTS